MNKPDNRGFTIIELLIATVVFSVILLIVTGAIIQFTRIYYKGVVNTKTQEVARAVVENIAKKAQYSKTEPTFVTVNGADGGYCIGDRLYKFKKNQPVRDNDHALVIGNNCSDTGGLFTAGNTEQLAENMKIIDLSISTTSPYTINLVIGYGDESSAEGCPALKLGGQFCSFASYSTTVTKRLN